MAKKAAATNAPPAQVGNQPDQPEAAPAHKADAVSTPDTPPAAMSPPAGADAGGAESEMLRPLILTVTAKRENFRRAGRAWSVAATTVDLHDFTPEQLEQLADENGKMLTITGE